MERANIKFKDTCVPCCYEPNLAVENLRSICQTLGCCLMSSFKDLSVKFVKLRFFSCRNYETKTTNCVSSARLWLSRSTARSNDAPVIGNDKTVRRCIGTARYSPITPSRWSLSGIRRVWRHPMSQIPLTSQTVRVFLLCESAVMAGQMRTRVSSTWLMRAQIVLCSYFGAGVSWVFFMWK